MSQDLANVNRTVTPWVIVAGHRPLYHVANSQGYGPDMCMCFDCPGSDSDNFENMMSKFNVDLHLSGHIHVATVTKPLINGKVIAPSAPGAYDAPVYAVIGNGGHPDAGVGNWTDNTWAQFYSSENGWTEIDAVSETTLRLSMFNDTSGTPMFSTEINRSWPRNWGSDEPRLAAQRERDSFLTHATPTSRAHAWKMKLQEREWTTHEVDHSYRQAMQRAARKRGFELDLATMEDAADW